MKGPRRNKQNVIGIDIAIFGTDCRTFHERQQITLHTLGRCIGTLGHVILGTADLVNFVHEHNARFLHGGNGLLLKVDILQQPLQFNVKDDIPSLGDGQRLAFCRDALCPRPTACGKLRNDLVHGSNVGIAGVTAKDDFSPRSAALFTVRYGHINFDVLLIELSTSEHGPEGFPRGVGSSTSTAAGCGITASTSSSATGRSG
mmetsp:Transcript_27652/g.55851  ORF Transcript_27652/g.55851 Transcript_27652/m.55851 type:complete len:202 (-) Transcript_27652:241-846(-)